MRIMSRLLTLLSGMVFVAFGTLCAQAGKWEEEKRREAFEILGAVTSTNQLPKAVRDATVQRSVHPYVKECACDSDNW